MFAATLTTERLALRPPRLEDAEALYRRYASDAEVTRYMSWRAMQSLDEELLFLTRDAESRAKGDSFQWVICVGDDPLPSGMVGFFPRPPRAEIGYVLARSMWGRGVMTEAVSAVVAEAWRHERLWRLDAWVHVDNAASARVLDKVGFRREGIARRRVVMPQLGPEPQDCLVYAQVRDDLIKC